jgi:hypothetical protein
MKLTQLYLIAILLVTSLMSAQAQSDSVHTEYKTEDEKISRDEIRRLIRYITRADEEEKTLIKIGAMPGSAKFVQNGFISQINLDTEISIEHKVHPSVSVLLGIDGQTLINFIGHRTSIYTSDPLWLLDRAFNTYDYAKAAVRYYYGMEKRIRKGQSANNLSGAYFAIQARRSVFNYYSLRYYEVLSGNTRKEKHFSSLESLNKPSFALQWGVQQRLGNRGYVDLSIGPELTFNNKEMLLYNAPKMQLSLRFSAIVGLGW